MKTHDDDDDELAEVDLVVGETEFVQYPGEPEHPAAVLWIPDPEQVSG